MRSKATVARPVGRLRQSAVCSSPPIAKSVPSAEMAHFAAFQPVFLGGTGMLLVAPDPAGTSVCRGPSDRMALVSSPHGNPLHAILPVLDVFFRYGASPAVWAHAVHISPSAPRVSPTSRAGRCSMLLPLSPEVPWLLDRSW